MADFGGHESETKSKTPIMELWKILVLLTILVHYQRVQSGGITFLDGDVYIEAVISLYSPRVDGSCGDDIDHEVVQNIESVRWTLMKLNESADDTLFGKQIGLRVHTTCRTEQSALDVGMELAYIMGNSSSRLDSIAVIGPDFSSEAEALSRLLSSFPEQYRLLQIGYAPTSASLKDKETFRNFFRTIPPDDIQVEVMNQLVQELDWTYMDIIYENDTYGSNGVDGLLSAIKTTNDLCFPFTVAVDPLETQEQLVQTIETELQNLIFGSNISGLLIFGSVKLATAVMKATENLKNSTTDFNIPTFLFAESSSYFEGSFRGVSKGAFAVSPPRKTIKQFEDHWVDIFTNVNLLYNAATSNIYLKKLYYDVFGCQLASSKDSHTCPVVTRDEVLDKLKSSLYNQYAIQAVMTAAKVAKEIYRSECGTTRNCDKLYEVPRKRFIDVLNTLTINFDDDFNLRLEEFKTPVDLQISFSRKTDVTLPPGYPVYAVYNHQKCPNDQSEFCFVEVATFSGDQLVVSKSKIRDYTQDGSELLWPSIRKPQCPDFSVCTLCLQADTDDVLFIPGDMYIIGIAPIHNVGSTPLKCGPIKPGGIDIVESIRFGINEAKSSFEGLVPNANIGVIIIDSCNDPQITQEKVLTLQRLGVFRNGAYIPIRDKILGYIGSWSSDVSMAVGDLTTRLEYVQISYGSTAQELSKRSVYPYFLRTPAPDSDQAKAMVDIVNNLGYNLIQILYSETSYGEGGKNLLIEAIRQDNNKICVAQSIPVSHLSNHDDIVRKINEHKEAKVILVFVSSFELEWLLPVFNNAFQNGEYLYIASEGWGTRTIVNGYQHLKGTITLTSELPVNNKFKDHLKELTPDGTDPNPWIRPYMERTFGCYYQWSFQKSSGKQCSGSERLSDNEDYKIDAWAPFVEKAVIALLRGAYTTLQQVCDSANSLCPAFRNTSSTQMFVDNVRAVELANPFGIRTRVFDDNGDGLAGYNIYTVAFGASSIYESIGESGTSFRFEKAQWQNVYGRAINSTCGNQPVCLKCFPGEPEVAAATQTVSSGVIVVIAILAIICCVLAGVLMWICNRHGCCVKIENGKVQFNSTYLTPTYLQEARPHPPDGSENTGPRRYTPGTRAEEELENYDVITDVSSAGSAYRQQRSFSGVGAERNHAFVQDEATPCKGGSGGHSGEKRSGEQSSDRGASDGSAHPRDVQLSLETTDANNANTDGYISATGT